MIDKIFDVIIVGAGPSGTLLSTLLSKEGISVALIEKSDETQVGKKPCGEGLIQHCFPEIAPNFLPEIKSVWVSPNVKIHLTGENNIATLKYRIHMIDRHQIIKHLLEISEKHGAEIFYNTYAAKPILRRSNVIGIKARRGRETIHFRGKLIVDASGFIGVLRNQLKKNFIEHNYSRNEVAIGYRIYARLSRRVIDTHVVLDPENTRGGYFWVFPRGPTNNIGVGAIRSYVDPLKFPSLVTEYLTQLDLNIEDISVAGAYGMIPARRPFASLVSDGVILIGDSGSITNPIHGGGICSGFRSAKIAFQTLIDKLEKNAQSLSIDDLWEYTYKLNTTEGKKHAIFEMGRILLEGLSKKDLRNLVSLIHNMFSDLRDKIISENKKSLISLSTPRLAVKLYKLKKLILKLREHYHAYPKTPHNIASWTNKTQRIFSFARRQFIR